MGISCWRGGGGVLPETKHVAFSLTVQYFKWKLMPQSNIILIEIEKRL